jgi:hypothetical protein
MVWIVFGTKEAAKRVPGGAQVVRRCDACGEQATFYEKDLTSTFRLYFIDVFDYRKHRVMQCGACSANFTTDELGARDEDLGTRVEKTLERGADAIGKAATTVGDELTGLAARFVGRPAPKRETPSTTARRRAPEHDDLSDDDLAALRELDDLETKFRALEEQEAAKKTRRS